MCWNQLAKNTPSSDKCLWLSTSRGDYALLVPRATYSDTWEASLHLHGSEAKDAQVCVWPTQGSRPDWWDAHWKDSWPWDEDEDAMEVDEDTQTGSGWPRLGPHGDLRFPGQPRSNLHSLSPWILSPDGLTLTSKE
ncbi:hypothetical protein RhiXN_01265 [Rhizoctonia solani]|uniref:Uncharacterized protein n=1 Tax=Rhizoctonia solani TaxID=456999 RepID=A0A8H8P8R2_9AGAM|nr:uncharacterized protein RhiXN_01265 [Rhizoctonia solani]QRW26670.1 hypothetical protein RhiXN_01265 [Rhizoctonia solani]